MRNHRHTWLGIVLVGALAAAMAGCSDDSPTDSTAATTNAATSGTVPTLAEVQSAVTLDDADVAVVKGALAQWRRSVANGATERYAHQHAMMDFVAAVAPSLDNAQLGDLATFLAERREAHHGDMGNGDRLRDRDRDRDGDRFAGWIEALGLSDEQAAAMKRLHEATQTRRHEQMQLMRAGTITREEFQQAMQRIQQAHREQLEQILTPEQLAKFDALRDERQDQRIDRRIERIRESHQHRVAWLTAVLNLDDEQKVRVTEASAALARAQLATLEALKADTITREVAHEQMRAAHETFENALQRILTAEQWERLQMLERLRRHHATS